MCRYGKRNGKNSLDNLEHETGRGYQGISVLALCETSCQLEVCFANRFRRIKTDDINFDHKVTNGGIWSRNVEDVKAWMPYSIELPRFK